MTAIHITTQVVDRSANVVEGYLDSVGTRHDKSVLARQILKGRVQAIVETRTGRKTPVLAVKAGKAHRAFVTTPSNGIKGDNLSSLPKSFT